MDKNHLTVSYSVMSIGALLFAVVTLCACGNSTKVEAAADSTEVETYVDSMAEYERTHSDEAILTRAKQIWVKSQDRYDPTSILTSSLSLLVKEENDTYNKYQGEGQPLWDNYASGLGTWGMDNAYKWKAGIVTAKTGETAYVRIRAKGDKTGATADVTWKMAYERGDWYVDDVKISWIEHIDHDGWVKGRLHDSIEDRILEHKCDHSN